MPDDKNSSTKVGPELTGILVDSAALCRTRSRHANFTALNRSPALITPFILSTFTSVPTNIRAENYSEVRRLGHFGPARSSTRREKLLPTALPSLKATKKHTKRQQAPQAKQSGSRSSTRSSSNSDKTAAANRSSSSSDKQPQQQHRQAVRIKSKQQQQ